MALKARVQRLRAEIGADRRAFDERVRELEELEVHPGADAGTLSRTAIALHHAYGSIEAILSRLAGTLGEGPATGPDWHRELLDAMGLDIEGVRPRALSADSLDRLDEFLKELARASE